MATLEEGRFALNRLADRMGDTRRLRDDYAHSVRRQAQRYATGRPSPQARAVAQVLQVKNGTAIAFGSRRTVASGRSVPAGYLTFGAEYGSTRYRQFAARNERGYWLHPAADDIDDRDGEKWLDRNLNDALRGIR